MCNAIGRRLTSVFDRNSCNGNKTGSQIFEPCRNDGHISAKLSQGDECGDKERCSENDRLDGGYAQSPLGKPENVLIRRFVLAICGVLFGLGFCLRGLMSFDYERPLRSAAQIWGGALFFVSSLVLYWLALFPSTYGWWL
jgi:hypothetical protein